MSFTFKTVKETGKYASFFTPQHNIKLKKSVVGEIMQTRNRDDEFKIRLAITKEPTKAEPAPFKWITLAAKFETLEEAKVWLNKNFNRITSQFDLYGFTD